MGILNDFSSDPLKKNGGIEIITSEAPIQIYGWVGDTPSKIRKDFRSIGHRNNTQSADPNDNLLYAVDQIISNLT